MNWNNAKLNEIQSIEDMLLTSKDYNGSLRTAFIHKTSELIDKDYQHKEIHISPYKKNLDKLVDVIAYYITCGEITERAVVLSGACFNTIKPKLTETHKLILAAARKQRKINKTKNK